MILASIAIYKCDHCALITVTSNQNEVEEFENNWFEGLIYHFCKDCKGLDAIKPQLAFEVEAYEALKESARENLEKGDVINAEFIN